MNEPLPDNGIVRKLWLGETDLYAAHLLRLDPDSRRRRFGGAMADEAVRRHAANARGLGVIIHGFFVDGVLRGSAELRITNPISRDAEAAFSIESQWQSHGIGSALLERTLLSARNRGVKRLSMHCLADNERMQQLAKKFAADLHFDFGGVIGDVDPPRSTALSLTREIMEDASDVANAIIEAQSRLLKSA
ncbi:MAG: GNAT family N-acetyltransferase [Pseudolabrys sp.]|nr:GNAT family N-acetyltransferase [Pseudolabrys sp.]